MAGLVNRSGWALQLQDGNLSDYLMRRQRSPPDPTALRRRGTQAVVALLPTTQAYIAMTEASQALTNTMIHQEGTSWFVGRVVTLLIVTSIHCWSVAECITMLFLKGKTMGLRHRVWFRRHLAISVLSGSCWAALLKDDYRDFLAVSLH